MVNTYTVIVDTQSNGISKIEEENKLLRNTSESRSVRKDTFQLLLSAFSAALNLTTAGCALTWTSPAIAMLKSEDPNINPLGSPVTPSQLAMMTGMPGLGSMLGTVIMPRILDGIGRKKTILIFGLVQISSYIALGLATKVYLYYVTRFLMGICLGLIVSGTTIYSSEIAETHNRGRYTAMVHIFIPIGSVLAYVLGVFFSIKIFTILCAVPAMFGLIIFELFGSEAPVYLIEKGDRAGALKTLRKLRGRKDVDSDIAEIDQFLSRGKSNEGFSIRTVVSDPAISKALKITCGLAIAQAFSGIMAIMAFLGPIFDSAGTAMSGNMIAILVGTLKAFCFVFTSMLVEKLGRRTLMLISTSSASVTLTVLGLYFQFKDNSDLPMMKNLTWLPVTCIFGFIIAYSLGIGAVTFVILGEIFPNHVKTKAVSFVALLTTSCGTLTGFGFPFVKEFLGIPHCFYIFGMSCGLSCFFVYFILPETKGKTFVEIQHILAGNKRIK